MVRMGGMVENAITAAVNGLVRRDDELNKKAIEADCNIDEMEKQIESRCLRIILQQQPVASDLRRVSAALKMITDMERIGDQASDIAEIVKHIDRRNIDGDTHISAMAKETIKMVTDSIESFVKKDIELATDVIKQDDNVDELFNKVKDELIETLRQPTECAEALIDLLMIAKYFERIGDHAENIAEWVIFSITGQHIDIGQND